MADLREQVAALIDGASDKQLRAIIKRLSPRPPTQKQLLIARAYCDSQILADEGGLALVKTIPHVQSLGFSEPRARNIVYCSEPVAKTLGVEQFKRMPKADRLKRLVTIQSQTK